MARIFANIPGMLCNSPQFALNSLFNRILTQLLQRKICKLQKSSQKFCLNAHNTPESVEKCNKLHFSTLSGEKILFFCLKKIREKKLNFLYALNHFFLNKLYTAFAKSGPYIPPIIPQITIVTQKLLK